MQELICEYCDIKFNPKRTNNNNPKRFCSPACANESKKTKVLKACIQCGKETLNPKFCCRSCAATFNNIATPKRKAKPKPYRAPKPILTDEEKYKRKRAIYNEANARYMAKRKFQTPADEDIKALQEFYANCPKGYEVDHIIPISKGGLHSLSNLQYLPKEENRRKSNKILARGPSHDLGTSVLETDILPIKLSSH